MEKVSGKIANIFLLTGLPLTMQDSFGPQSIVVDTPSETVK
jgi:hypothetical protein